jgi:hypothetical protein
MASRVHPVEDRALQAQWQVRFDDACQALQLRPYPDSLTVCDGWAFALVRQGTDKHLLVLSSEQSRLADFRGTRRDVPGLEGSAQAALCPLTPDNARQLRHVVPFLAPVVLGGGVSIGTGDRLGLATPGHVRALGDCAVQPVLAQQSIRELSRTNRAPREVLDDALWGILQTGYRAGYAADADHLKTIDDIDLTLDAGFSLYTVDPGDLVDNEATRAPADYLVAQIPTLPWNTLECTPDDCRRRYADRTVTVAGRRGSFALELSRDAVLRAVVKYGRAIARTVVLYRHLASRCPRERWAFEVAVDETDTPTTAAEHFYVASELRRLGLRWESLAPRFVGSFRKGVDYVGDLEEFRREFGKHALIAEQLDGYKLSLHSGSDKFSIYPIIAELAGDAIHIKTSGTSYLEALRVVAAVAPDLFREVVAFARQRYQEDGADYHVHADLTKMVDPQRLRDEDLPLMLDQPDTRQVCHVTFGSVLVSKDRDGRPRFRDRLFAVLRNNEELYHRRLEEHFRRHLRAFI